MTQTLFVVYSPENKKTIPSDFLPASLSLSYCWILDERFLFMPLQQSVCLCICGYVHTHEKHKHSWGKAVGALNQPRAY